MKSWKILASKEVKAIHKLLDSQFGFTEKLDYAFLKNSKDNVYVVNKEIANIDFDQLRLNSVGMYIGELKNERFRLSIEGSQLVGPKASTNIVDVSNEEAIMWIKGNDIEIPTELKGVVIVKHENDFLGSGLAKEGKLLNHVPKSRRLPANA
jgi:NOL1/NOP2/fmu family ribosome biogenesis protein